MKILYFAWLRARIGCAEEELPLPAEIRDVAGLLDWLRARGPRFAEALRDLSVVRVAVNQDYVGCEPGERLAQLGFAFNAAGNAFQPCVLELQQAQLDVGFGVLDEQDTNRLCIGFHLARSPQGSRLIHTNMSLSGSL